MPRKRTGSAFRFPKKTGPWYVQVTLKNGERSPRMLIGDVTEAAAITARDALQAKADRGELVRADAMPSNVITVLEWFEKWFDWRKERGYVNAENDRGRFRKWIAPKLGAKFMVEVTKADLEDVVSVLDDVALEHAAAERAGEAPDLKTTMSAKSAVNVWGILTKGFDDAVRSKNRAMRVLETNPAAGVMGPDRGADKARSSLTPNKLAALVSNEEIPASLRVVVVLAVYTGLRAAELRALRWSDVNFDDGVIDVHHTLDREGEAGTTKSEQPRKVQIEPALRPLLETMHALARGDGRVVELHDDRHLARFLRALLRAAGLGGTELERSATRAALTWHDLRGTWCTWRAIRGDEPIRIMAEAGHEDMSTTMKYIRLADVLRPGYGAVFPELPETLLESLRREAAAPEAAELAKKEWWRRRESKNVGDRIPPQNCADSPSQRASKSSESGSQERFASDSLPGLARAARALTDDWDALERAVGGDS